MDKNERIKKELEKTKLYYRIMDIWFSQEQKGKSLIPYMREKNYKRVAIYGMGELGERLYYELIHGGIEVKCVIDQSPYVLGEFVLIKPTELIPDVDAIIVTAEYYLEDIYNILRKNTNVPIVALSGLIGNAFKMNW